MTSTALLQQKSKVKGIAIWFCIVAALGGLLFGLDQGFINGSLDFIMKYWGLSLSGGESYAGIMLIGCVIGAILSGWITRAIGRKYMLVIAALFFTIFSFWGSTTHSYEILYWTRFCLGLAVGSASFVVPLYLSEIAPTKIRGAMLTLYQFFLTIGIMGIYFSNTYCDKVYSPTWGDATWRLMLAFIGIPAVVMLVLAFFIPKTPRFLMLKNKEDQARKVLEKTLATNEECDLAIKEIKDGIEQDAKLKASGALKSIIGKGFFKRVLVLGILLQVFQQLTGINTVIYYSGIIFHNAGVSNPAAGTILVGIINVLATIIAIVCIDKFGKKPLLSTGLIIMIITLIINGIMFSIGNLGTFGQITLVISTLVFIVGFAYSWGPVVWAMCAEIFPLEGREFGMVVTTAVNWIFAFIVVRFSLTIMNSFGGNTLFFIFAIFCIIALIFTKYIVPETKGITLEEIETNLKSGKKLREIGKIN